MKDSTAGQAGARSSAWPASTVVRLVGVALATLVAEAAGLDVARIGALPSELPVPSLTFLDLAAVPSLLPSAVAVAALAGLESLLSATVADGMTVTSATIRTASCSARASPTSSRRSSAGSPPPARSPVPRSTSAPAPAHAWPR